jgi:hypothetical protein
VSVRVLGLGLGVGPPPPGDEPGPAGVADEQCGVSIGGEFESSPSAAAKELTLLRCL